MINLKNKNIIVTGPKSMIGRSVIKLLKKREANVWPLSHEEVNLLDQDETFKVINNINADYCLHLAGFNGNIRFNSIYPADIFFKTTQMGLNVLYACAENGVAKTVSVLSSCGYRAGEEPLKEEDFLNGEPDESTEAHAYGKRDLLIYSKLLHKQLDYNAVCSIFNTTYGPYDSFDLNKTKVVGSLIKKFVDAVEDGADEVECWGTGNPRRELIYCDDAAEGIIQTLEKYNDPTKPLNIGFNEDIKLQELSQKIADAANFKGKILWDLSRPDGVSRKLLDSSRMKDFNITINQTPLEVGLKNTIEFYKEQNK